MRANSCHPSTWLFRHLRPFGTIWAGFASAMFPYCSPTVLPFVLSFSDEVVR
jgi:hypothetical protein